MTVADPVAVGYAPGSWVGLAGPDIWLLAEVEPSSAVVGHCWELISAGANEDDVCVAMTRPGFRTVRSFALVRWDEEAVHAIVRGQARVELRTRESGVLHIVPAGADDWAHRQIAGAMDEIRLRAGDGMDEPMRLPLTTGVVLASVLGVMFTRPAVVDPVAEPAAPVSEPSALVLPVPEPSVADPSISASSVSGSEPPLGASRPATVSPGAALFLTAPETASAAAPAPETAGPTAPAPDTDGPTAPAPDVPSNPVSAPTDAIGGYPDPGYPDPGRPAVTVPIYDADADAGAEAEIAARFGHMLDLGHQHRPEPGATLITSDSLGFGTSRSEAASSAMATPVGPLHEPIAYAVASDRRGAEPLSSTLPPEPDDGMIRSFPSASGGSRSGPGRPGAGAGSNRIGSDDGSHDAFRSDPAWGRGARADLGDAAGDEDDEDDLGVTTIRRRNPNAAHSAPGGPSVLAVRCVSGHDNPVSVTTCRTCASPITDRTQRRIERPVLGALRLSNGDAVPLDRGVIFGRAPDVPAGTTLEKPNTVRLAHDTDISRNHVEIRLDGWRVLVIDLGSTNGTFVAPPGGQFARLDPHGETELLPGSVVSLSEETTFRFEVTG